MCFTIIRITIKIIENKRKMIKKHNTKKEKKKRKRKEKIRCGSYGKILWRLMSK